MLVILMVLSSHRHPRWGCGWLAAWQEVVRCGCKVCGVTFPNRQALLKHINKMGHFRDPNEMALPEGMFYIRDSSERPGLLR